MIRFTLTLLDVVKDPVPNGSNACSWYGCWEPKFANPSEAKGSVTLSSLLNGSSAWD